MCCLQWDVSRDRRAEEGGYILQLPALDPLGPAFLKHPVRLEVQAIRVIAITRAGVHAG